MSKEELMMKILTAPADMLAKVAQMLNGYTEAPATCDRKLLTFSAAADTLGVSRQTVWRMVRDGRLPTIELRAGRFRVPSSALTDLLKGGKS